MPDLAIPDRVLDGKTVIKRRKTGPFQVKSLFGDQIIAGFWIRLNRDRVVSEPEPLKILVKEGVQIAPVPALPRHRLLAEKIRSRRRG